ncbi:MAG: amino acid ABC transporter permease [Pollutimonas bauzanensis]
MFLNGALALGARLGLDYSFLLDAYDRNIFVEGAATTVVIAVLSMAGSLLVGVVVAAMLTRGRWLRAPARALVEVLRNTPTLVQLYCAFLVFNMLVTQALKEYGIDNPLSPFLWVVVVLSVHKGVFHAEALRAGIEAVPAATLDAARSLGFSRHDLLWRVELPLALRFALPSLVNNLIDLVKGSAVASAVAVGDITYASIMIWTNRDNVLELMILILLFFGALTFAVNQTGRWLEERLRMPGYGQ